MEEQSNTKVGCLLPLGLIMAAIAFCLLVSFVRFEINRRAKHIDIRLDRRIAEEINALVESELRSLMELDADLAQWGELRSWEPQFWSRGGPAWGTAAEANWRLGISGVAHFEKADIPVEIVILRGPIELRMKRAKHRHIVMPGGKVMPVISGGAGHPDFVQGPPHRSEDFARNRR